MSSYGAREEFGGPPRGGEEPAWMRGAEYEDGSRQRQGAPGAQGQAAHAPAQQQAQLRPRRDCALTLFLLISACTALSAVSVAVAQVLSIAFTKGLTAAGIAIRCYGVVLSAGVVFGEMEWNPIREFVLVQNWFSRGLAYIFVGLLALEETDEKGLSNATAEMFVSFAALGLVVLGMLYSLMGICCLKRIRDQKMARYIQLLSHAEVQEALRERAMLNTA